MPSFTINARGYGSRRSRLCEKSVVQFACRTSVSVSSIRKPIALATSVGRRQLRKQFCASLAHATFHTAWKAGIQYAAAIRLKHWRSGILGRPVKPSDDSCGCGNTMPPLSRRERARALECRPRRAAIDVTVERWARRHHLEQPHREVQPRADDDIRGRELFAEDPRSLR